MDLLFYHLERSPLSRVLPDLLQKSMSRGWRAVVETQPFERVEALDQMLWTFEDDSFLPHGIAGQPDGDLQPILLTDTSDNPNNADIRFFVDGGEVLKHKGYERLVYLFNGNDMEALTRARREWKSAKDAGIDMTYWAETPDGGFEKKA